MNWNLSGALNASKKFLNWYPISKQCVTFVQNSYWTFALATYKVNQTDPNLNLKKVINYHVIKYNDKQAILCKHWLLHNYHYGPTMNKYKSINVEDKIENLPSKDRLEKIEIVAEWRQQSAMRKSNYLVM